MTRALSAATKSVERLTPIERDHWDFLCASRPELQSAFYSRMFAEAVASVRPDVRVCVISEQNRPVAYLPFQFPNRLARAVRSAERVGGHLSDYFGLVAGSDFEIDRLQLVRLAGLSRIEFTHLAESQLVHGLRGERPTIGVRYNISAGRDAFWGELKSRDQDFYAHTMRQVRRAEREYGVLDFTLKALDGPAELDRVIESKRQQYKQTGVADALETEWSRRLLTTLANTTSPLCEGVISVLRAGDTWLASHFGLRSGGVLHYWFPVYNPEAAKVSPGRLLLKSLIDHAEGEGIRLIDDGEANEAQRQKHQLGNSTHQYFRGEWESDRSIRFFGRLESGLRWRIRTWRGV